MRRFPDLSEAQIITTPQVVVACLTSRHEQRKFDQAWLDHVLEAVFPDDLSGQTLLYGPDMDTFTSEYDESSSDLRAYGLMFIASWRRVRADVRRWLEARGANVIEMDQAADQLWYADSFNTHLTSGWMQVVDDPAHAIKLRWVHKDCVADASRQPMHFEGSHLTPEMIYYGLTEWDNGLPFRNVTRGDRLVPLVSAAPYQDDLTPLSERLDLPLTERLGHFINGLSGLKSLHDGGFVHADFCLRQILIQPDHSTQPTARLSDFEGAINCRDTSSIGTVRSDLYHDRAHYQYDDAMTSDCEAVDVFAAGVSLLELWLQEKDYVLEWPGIFQSVYRAFETGEGSVTYDDVRQFLVDTLGEPWATMLDERGHDVVLRKLNQFAYDQSLFCKILDGILLHLKLNQPIPQNIYQDLLHYFPIGVLDLILDCLQKDRGQRPSVNAMIQRLEIVRNGIETT